MLTVFICEDNEVFLNRIKTYITSIIKKEKITATIACATPNPNEILDYIKRNKVIGLYFLDLDLGCETNGFELADKIRKHDPRAFIVIVTSDSESKQLSFEYVIEAMDYITKGTHNFGERIKNCVITAHQRCSEHNRTAKKLSIKLFENVTAQDDVVLYKGSIIHLDCTDIFYIEVNPGRAHQVTIHCSMNNFVTRSDLSKIHPLLDSRFVRCHKSCIVNVEKIFNFNPEKGKLWLSNGKELDMGGTYVSHVRQGLNDMYARL